jgi:hypothetical protein
VIDWIFERIFEFLFKVLWRFLIKPVLMAVFGPLVLGRELWKVWYPKGVQPAEKRVDGHGNAQDDLTRSPRG